MVDHMRTHGRHMWLWPHMYVIKPLTRDLFAVANLVVKCFSVTLYLVSVAGVRRSLHPASTQVTFRYPGVTVKLSTSVMLCTW